MRRANAKERTNRRLLDRACSPIARLARRIILVAHLAALVRSTLASLARRIRLAARLFLSVLAGGMP